MDSTNNDDSSLPIDSERSGRYDRMQSLGPEVTSESIHQFQGTGAMNTAGSGRVSPSMAFTMKDLEKQITDLKKENFGLKLRIYYMEERMAQNFENDDNVKTNIELKVEAEHLKQELKDKDQLLLKASQAVECLAQEKEQLLQKQAENDNQHHVQEKYETKLRDKEEENTRLKEMGSNLQRQLDEAKQLREELEKAARERTEERRAIMEDNKSSLDKKEREIDELLSNLRHKDELISNLRKERVSTEDVLTPLQSENNELKRQISQTENRVTEQQARIDDLERALRDAGDDLEEKEKQNKDLGNQLRSTQMAEMEASQALLLHDQEKQTLESNANKSYKAIQKFVQALREKEKEIAKLREELADKENEVHEARDNEDEKYEDLYLQLAEAKQGAGQGSKDMKAYYEGKLAEKLSALEVAEEEKEDMGNLLKDKENDIMGLKEELLEQNQKYKVLEDKVKDSDAKNKQLSEAVNSQIRAKEGEIADLRQSLNDKDDVIGSLKQSLAGKDSMIENLQDLLEGQSKEDLFKQLTAKLKDKEKQLQEMVAERADVAKINEKSTIEMLDAIRDKDEQIKDLNSELSRQALDDNKKIHELQRQLADMEMEVKGAGDALSRAEKEQDGMLAKMRKAMEDKDKTIEKLMDSGREKDRLFLERQQAQLHPGIEVQRLKDEVDGLKESIAAKDDELRRLRATLPEKGEVDSLMSELQHKNKMLENARTTIDQLQQPSETDQYEMLKQRRKIKDLEAELDDKQRRLDDKAREDRERDRLNNEMRVQVNLAECRPAKDSCSEDIHSALKQQLQELSKLTEVLKAERQLYVNITQSDTGREAELAAIQALCSQLVQGVATPQTNGASSTREHSPATSGPRIQHEMGAQTEIPLSHGVRESESPPRHRTSLEKRPPPPSLGDRRYLSRNIPGQENQEITALRTRVRELQTDMDSKRQEMEALRKELENRPPSSLELRGRSVPGQENQELTALRTKVKELQGDVDSKKQELAALRRELQEEASGQVPPILKQQLDQAKSLLGEKDTQLQRWKQECQELTDAGNDLRDQNRDLKEVSEGLARKMEDLGRETPRLRSQLEWANSLIRKQKRENASLRERLGIGSDGDVTGRSRIDDLEAANARLQQDADDLRRQLADGENLRKKLETAENMNELLKKHIALNTPKDESRARFDPSLIVNLAHEIEELREELKRAGVNIQGRGDSVVDKGVLTALEEQLKHSQGELKASRLENRMQQQKLRATEGTAHLQADRIQRYRRQLHNHGLSPAATPKRFHSDSNLSLSGLRVSRPLSDIEVMRSAAADDSTYADFGDSDNVLELKEQVEVLKNENNRCRQIASSHLHSQSGSRSSTPSRSLSPERDTSSWFQTMAGNNEGTVVRLQQEVESLRSQLVRANELNATIHDQYKDIQAEIEQAHSAAHSEHQPSSAEQTQLQAKDREINLLLGYLEESKKLADMMRQMLIEALGTMEDIKQTYGDGGGGSSSVVQKLDVTMDRLRSSADIAESLHNAHNECSSSSGKPTQRRKSSFAESLKKKLTEISALQKELSRSKKRNQSLNRLLQENQNTAEETRQELKKQTENILQKQQTISALQRQIREMARPKHSTSVATQTGTPAQDDLAQLYARLRENQLLVCTLKSELQVYRDVLHSKSPSGSPHSAAGRGVAGCAGTEPEDTLRAYLEELRALRKRLEETERDNERLRKQLEGNLNRDNGSIHETNIKLKTRVETLNIKLKERDQTNQKLREDYKKLKTDFVRVRTENERLSEQLVEKSQLQTSLRFELGVYEQMYPKEQAEGTPRLQDPKTGIDLTEILNEMRRLRIQLERSIDTNNALRAKLEEMMAAGHWTTEYREQRSTEVNHHSRRLFVHSDSASDQTASTSPYEDPQFQDMPGAKDKPKENGSCTGQFMVCSLQTYEKLKKSLRECKSLMSALTTSQTDHQVEGSLSTSVQQRQSLIHKVSLLIDESNLAITRFQLEHLPRSEELTKLKKQIVTQQKLMKRLSHSKQSKNSVEDVIIKNLMQHEATLVQVQRNLESKKTKTTTHEERPSSLNGE